MQAAARAKAHKLSTEATGAPRGRERSYGLPAVAQTVTVTSPPAPRVSRAATFVSARHRLLRLRAVWLVVGALQGQI